MNVTVRHLPLRGLALVLCLLLIFSCVPAIPAGQAENQAFLWSDNISGLLTAAPYEEGTVIAGFQAASEQELSGFPEGISVTPLFEVSTESLLSEGSFSALLPSLTALAARQETVLLAEVASSSLTTEQLLRTLAEDSRVLCAEPNYLSVPLAERSEGELASYYEAAFEKLSSAESEDSEEDEPEAPVPSMTPHAQVVNMAPWQWGLTDESTYRDPSLEGKNPDSASLHILPNLTGTGSNMDRTIYAAVLDGFVDYRHPDLSSVVVHFSEQEQKALGCGEWGYNASTIGKAAQTPEYFTPENHGTHVAGLMGAAWDGHGISGAASNLKIVSVQVDDPHVNGNKDGLIMCSALLRGFAFVDTYNQYYSATAPEKVIRIINISIGSPFSTLCLNAAAYELGRKYGTITFIAAGNDGSNNDFGLEAASSMRRNPYVIVVAATDQSGKLAVYSNYGLHSVALAAPGSAMISTVTVNKAAYFPGLFTEGPQADIFCETFANFDKSGSKFEIAQISDYAGKKLNKDYTILPANQGSWVGGHALSFTLDQSMVHLNNEEDEKEEKVYSTCFFVRVHLTKEQADKLSSSGTEAQIGVIARGADRLDPSIPVTLYDGTPLTQKNTLDNPTVLYLEADRNETSSIGLVASSKSGESGDNNNLSNLFGENWSPRAETLEMILEFTFPEGTKNIIFDCFSIGTSKIAYSVYDGTSMATPSAAGTAAVIAARHPDETGAQLAARIRASVVPVSSMQGKTSTGARLDLNKDTAGTWQDPGEIKAQWPVFEKDLPLDTSTGNPFRFDALGDKETYGHFLAGDDRLWYLPVNLGDYTLRNEAYIYEDVLCFDPATETWDASRSTKIPGAPLWNVSAGIWNGSLWVYGLEATRDADGYFYVDDTSTPVPHVLSMDLKTGVWSRHSTSGLRMPTTTFLFANDDGVRFFDTGANGKRSDPKDKPEKSMIYNYDPQSGIGKLITEIKDPDHSFMYPVFASYGSTTWIVEPETNFLYRLEGSTATRIKFQMPDSLSEKNPDYYSKKATNDMTIACYLTYTSVTAGKDALYFVGRMDKNKKADTWVLPHGSSTIQPLEKHLANVRPLTPSSVFYNGKLYAIATDLGSVTHRIFRTTRVEGADPLPTAEPIPKTGDTGTPFLWVLMILLALPVLVFCLRSRKKNT